MTWYEWPLFGLSGERTDTNAVFNLTTQLGGGKTHALTLLYRPVVIGQINSHTWIYGDMVRHSG